MTSPARASPITDSPWFWAYLFGTAALIALALAGSKYGPRQAQIEREFQGRQRAAQQKSGQEPDVGLSTAQATLVSLRPLFLALAGITVIAWVVFWRQHRLRQRAVQEAQRVERKGPDANGTTEMSST
jgi:hypothetical protein